MRRRGGGDGTALFVYKRRAGKGIPMLNQKFFQTLGKVPFKQWKIFLLAQTKILSGNLLHRKGKVSPLKTGKSCVLSFIEERILLIGEKVLFT
jgi:hypothetical protein